MKKEIKLIALISAGVLAFSSLFGATTQTPVQTTEGSAAQVNTVSNDLIKKIEVVNGSSYDVKLFFTEQEPGEAKTKQQHIKVDKGDTDSKRVEYFGKGKMITDIKYVVYFDGNESMPYQAQIGNKAAIQPLPTQPQQKVNVTVTRDFAAENKILHILITDADIQINAPKDSMKADSMVKPVVK